MVEVGFTILINVPRHNFHRACSSCKMSQNLKLKLIKYEIAIQFQKTLKYGIAIHAKSQSSSKNFYKFEIENQTKFQKILKYRIAIHAKSQSSS